MKRKHIPLSEKLASALACLLTQEQRDRYRGLTFEQRGYTAKEMIGLFDWDHAVLHSHGGADKWWNLTPMLRAAHREKSRRDISIAAKVKRLRAKNGLPAGLLDVVDADDRQMPCHGYRKAAGETFARPRPKRRIPQRARPWPPKRDKAKRGKKATQVMELRRH